MLELLHLLQNTTGVLGFPTLYWLMAAGFHRDILEQEDTTQPLIQVHWRLGYIMTLGLRTTSVAVVFALFQATIVLSLLYALVVWQLMEQPVPHLRSFARWMLIGSIPVFGVLRLFFDLKNRR